MPAVNLREWCFDQIDYEEELLFADGFDDAILGLTYRAGHSIVLYDRDACIRILMARDEMSLEDAEEFFDYNVAGAYHGPKTPLYITTPHKDGFTTPTN